MTGQRLLVLGASGFLGGHVLDRATAAGLEVVTAGRAEPPGPPGSSAHWTMDLAAADPAWLGTRLAALAPDAVVNCAGATRGTPEELAAINVTGVYTLVSAMLLAGGPFRPPAGPGRARRPRGPRLVHLGSAAEYGPGTPGTAVAESAPTRPVGAYGATKLAATQLVALARAAGLDTVVLRVFNPVGPGAPESLLPGRVAAEFRRALTTGTAVSLGPLDAVRDFVDARDVADAVLAAALAPALPDPVINVASGSAAPARALVSELAAITGYHGPVREGADGSPRSAPRSWQQADISLARRALDWQPRHDLAASLADLWEDRHAPVPG